MACDEYVKLSKAFKSLSLLVCQVQTGARGGSKNFFKGKVCAGGFADRLWQEPHLLNVRSRLRTMNWVVRQPFS